MYKPETLKEEDFDKLITGKNILYIPIVSSINRHNNEYNLDTDGNINRTVTTFLRNRSYNTLSIILPEKHDRSQTNILDSFVKEGRVVDITYSSYFGKHAGEQRSDRFLIMNLVDETIRQYGSLDDFDYVICDSQYLIEYLVKFNFVPTQKLIFWNYLCSTNNHKRSFTEPLREITEWCCKNVGHIITTSPDITEYVKGLGINSDRIIYMPKFVDRNFETFYLEPNTDLEEKLISMKIENDALMVYLPFRLTDEAYKMQEVLEFIDEVSCRHFNATQGKTIVLYCDPNNSGALEDILKKWTDNGNEFFGDCVRFEKVSPDRRTFYTIIDSKELNVWVPYFEDIEYANHAAIWEFKDSAAKVFVFDDKEGKDMCYYEEGDKSLFLAAHKIMA